MLITALFALSFALAAPNAPVMETETFFVVGEPAPHVHLPDVRTGIPVELESYRGKKVLLAEFASW